MEVGAFTRQPAGPIGQPFYGWLTTAMVFSQAASAAFVIWRRPLKTAYTRIVAHATQPAVNRLA